MEAVYSSETLVSTISYGVTTHIIKIKIGRKFVIFNVIYRNGQARQAYFKTILIVCSYERAIFP
jgi:hypothetical protein